MKLQECHLCPAHSYPLAITPMQLRHHQLHSIRVMPKACELPSSSLRSSICSRCPSSSRATSSIGTPSSTLPLGSWVGPHPPTTPLSCRQVQPWGHLQIGSSMVHHSMISHSKSRHRVLFFLEAVGEVIEAAGTEAWHLLSFTAKLLQFTIGVGNTLKKVCTSGPAPWLLVNQ